MTKWIYKIGLLAFVLVLSATAYSVPKSCPFQDHFRRHLWNEAGQLALFVSDEYCGYYAYDARGERAYKLTGVVFTDQYDAGTIQATVSFDDAVLYVNPYMVVTPRGYTKHYYNGSQRIAARLGDYWAASVADESDMIARAREVLEQTMNSGDVEEEYFEEKYVRSIDGEEFYLEPFTLYTHYRTCTYPEDILHEVLNGGARLADHIGGIDRGIFYYHPDHLGSSSWITDDRRQVVQYLHYMPFGELWENQQFSEYDERFKFTGKERDTETGYDYFGARYYASTLPMWLSVDPLADKYPGINPYAYCAWNPVKYVDPDGREITITGEDGVTVTYVPNGEYKGTDNFTKQMWSDLDAILATKSGETVVNELSDDRGDAFNISSQITRGPDGLTVCSYSNSKREIKMGGISMGIEALAHETFHAYQDLYGYGGASCANDVEAYLFQGLVYGELYNLPSFGVDATFQLQPVDDLSQYANTYIDIMLDGKLDVNRLNNLANGFKGSSRAGTNGVSKNYTTFSRNQQYRILNFWGK